MPRDLATAQDELDSARATLATLEEQVVNGDDQVTPKQLADQRELIGFAELRVKAAESAAARLVESDRAELADAAKTAATELVTGDGMPDIATAAKAAADAIAALAALAYARNDAIAEIGTTLALIDSDLAATQDAEPWASRRYGVWGDRSRISVHGTGIAARLDVGQLAALTVLAGLGVTADGREAATDAGRRLHGLPNLAVRGLLKAYPVLADQFRVTPEEFAAADARGRYILSDQGRHPAAQGVQA